VNLASGQYLRAVAGRQAIEAYRMTYDIAWRAGAGRWNKVRAGYSGTRSAGATSLWIAARFAPDLQPDRCKPDHLPSLPI